jgi:non-specific serine/threonine protein kinase
LFRYRFGTAEFDEARFELKVAGLPVEVEKRALDVLAYLLRHAGEVVTKEELLEQVWAGRITVEKVLPNAINKLRRALGEANANLISTQARVGYRLDAQVTRTAVGRQEGSELNLAVGQVVQGRNNFLLKQQLARTGGSEVWLAEHSKTRELRVYKFALDGDQLRSLKREATLMRVLQESLSESNCFVAIIDWNFEQSPFFLECQFGGDALPAWCEAHLQDLDRQQRIALFLQIARAVALAHSLGVLHKDLKPANILVSGQAAQPQVRLTDFGSGHLLEPDKLEQLGITRMGMTVTDADDFSSGTPIYLAPEVFAGHAPTVRSDVYALGILLYQLLSSRINQPLASGFEHELHDELLAADIRAATDGDPARRIATANELIERLETLEARRNAQRARAEQAEQERRDQAELLRNRARRPFLLALIAALFLGLGTTLWFHLRALEAGDEARAELKRAQAITSFLNEDLIGRGNPWVAAKGASATLKEVLLAARDRLSARLVDEPLSEAVIRSNLAVLFNVIELLPESRAEAERALTLLEAEFGQHHEQTLRTRALLARILARLGKLDETKQQLDQLDRDARGTLREQVAAAHSTYFIARGNYAEAEQALAEAVRQSSPGLSRDSLRLDWISVLSYLKRYPEALTQMQSLVSEAKLRPGDSELLIALAKLAAVRALDEDYAAMEALLLEVRAVLEARLGKDHSRTLQAVSEQLRVAFKREDWPRAIAFARETHTGMMNKFGMEHAVTHVSAGNLARALYEGGDAKQAWPVALDALTALERTAGPNAPMTHDVRAIAACVAIELGARNKAEQLIAALDVEQLEIAQANGRWPEILKLMNALLAYQQEPHAHAAKEIEASIALLRAANDPPKRLLFFADQTMQH